MRVAIIGAGPGGIVTAKFLTDEGIEPVIFEQSDLPGGQWHCANTHSGIWPGMPTNTSRIMTQFSDLEHLAGTPAFPLAEEIHAYLNRYIKLFDLEKLLRLNCRVSSLSRTSKGKWTVSFDNKGNEKHHEEFEQVIIASGRFKQPFIPEISGLSTTGQRSTAIKVMHSCEYNGAEDFKGQRVLVAGGAISALEIACDLATGGAQSVTSCYRSQRYVLGKLADGVPTDHFNFSLYEALAAEILSPEQTATAMKDFVLSSVGNPAAYGAFTPHQDLRVAGATKCDHFLPLVKAGRIKVRPWIRNIKGNRIEFEDGTTHDIDVLVCGTGYRLDIPFLDAEVSKSLSLDEEHIALYKHTFHPDLPGLSVLGFYNQVGPYFPALELQARWIASVIGGRTPLPDRNNMQAGLDEYFQSWESPQKMPMHKLALLFSRAMGTNPNPAMWPGIQRSLLFGPLSATLFRLSGPGCRQNAADKIRNQAKAFAMIENEKFTSLETQKLAAIALVLTSTGDYSGTV